MAGHPRRRAPRHHVASYYERYAAERLDPSALRRGRVERVHRLQHVPPHAGTVSAAAAGEARAVEEQLAASSIDPLGARAWEVDVVVPPGVAWGAEPPRPHEWRARLRAHAVVLACGTYALPALLGVAGLLSARVCASVSASAA